MNHRHLLPNEIDLLLDDEVGFGVAPLKAHVRDCADCRARVDEARTVFDALEGLPHLAPSFNFSDKVMAQVPVFVPWHVAARDAIGAWVPRSRAARVGVLALASSVATMLTVAILWIVTRPDVVVVGTGLIGDRIPQVIGAAAHDVAVSLLGEQAFAVMQSAGVIGLAVGIVGFLVFATGAVFGLKAIATASTRRRA